MPQWRINKYNEDTPSKAYRLALLGLTVDEMAFALDVASDTIYKWCRQHPEFKEAIDNGRIEADGRVAESMYKMAQNGDYRAAKWWLQNRSKMSARKIKPDEGKEETQDIGNKWNDTQVIEGNPDKPLITESSDPLRLAKEISLLLLDAQEQMEGDE